MVRLGLPARVPWSEYAHQPDYAGVGHPACGERGDQPRERDGGRGVGLHGNRDLSILCFAQSIWSDVRGRFERNSQFCCGLRRGISSCRTSLSRSGLFHDCLSQFFDAGRPLVCFHDFRYFRGIGLNAIRSCRSGGRGIVAHIHGGGRLELSFDCKAPRIRPSRQSAGFPQQRSGALRT